jgi:hypothetical protein
MWDPRHLTALQGSTAWYRDSFASIFSIGKPEGHCCVYDSVPDLIPRRSTHILTFTSCIHLKIALNTHSSKNKSCNEEVSGRIHFQSKQHISAGLGILAVPLDYLSFSCLNTKRLKVQNHDFTFALCGSSIWRKMEDVWRCVQKRKRERWTGNKSNKGLYDLYISLWCLNQELWGGRARRPCN